jgi:predicted AlkP superfamily pyrophosphatase or phosphodiesterase
VPRVIVISVDGLAGFYWSDARARMPTLRALAARGALATRVDTVFPSTTWPSHATIVTGVRSRRHGVVANSILNRATGAAEDLTGDPIHDADALYRVPTLWDVARAAGLGSAAIDWPGTRHASGLGWSLPFFKDQTVFREHTPAHVWDELVASGHPVERMGEWAELPKRFLKDAMIGALAGQVYARHAPDLLLVHFLCTDSFQHLWGPRSHEAYWAIEYVDERIRQFLASLPDGEVPERTSLVVLSDHGFFPVEREIRPNVRLRELGLLAADDAGRIVGGPARFVSNGGGGMVYLEHADPRGLARELATELARVEGVASVWTEDAFDSLGLPSPRTNARVGDLVVETEPPYMFVNDATEGVIAPTRRYRGTHGHLGSRPDNRAFFLAVGPRVKAGIELGPIATVDVAPTIASLLGVSLGDVEGRTLTEIFV